MPSQAAPWLNALRASHDDLVSRVKALSVADLARPSYCSNWDVSQVLSHLGSGAEISLIGLERAVDGQPPQTREDFPPIWSRWDSMSREERSEQVVVWDRRSVSVAQGLGDEVLAGLQVELFGMHLDAAGLFAIRLGEHVLHTWDLAVTFDDEAELPTGAAELLLDRLPLLAGHTGKAGAAAGPRHIEVQVSGPERHVSLSIDDNVSLAPAPPGGSGPGTAERRGKPDGLLVLPAAALVRLVHGRLDQAHTPTGVRAEGSADLDELRQVFPGF